MFAPNVVRDNGWGQRVGEEFFFDLEAFVPFEEITWVSELRSPTGAAVAYNATDPVTLLRHRVVCMLEVDGDRITSLVEASGTIPPDTFLHFVTGDATHPQIDGPKVIAHVCNDIGGWGKGFVLALSRRWSEPEKAYRAWAKGEGAPFALGEVQFVEVKPQVWVANMVGQHGIRSTKAGPPIRYDAVATALKKLASFASGRNASVHMPRIGCGLAGGEWERIEGIINATLVPRFVSVYVYDLPPKRGGG